MVTLRVLLFAITEVLAKMVQSSGIGWDDKNCDNDRSGYEHASVKFERIACPVAQIKKGHKLT
jgi:hypothetical protein